MSWKGRTQMAEKGSKPSAEAAHEAALGARLNGPELALGPWASDDLIKDPKRLAFVLARYKFVARMLEGRATAMEVGCGDGLGLPLVAQAVGRVWAVDWEGRVLEGNRRRLAHLENVTYLAHDFVHGPADVRVEAVYNVDVIEHVAPDDEAAFMANAVAALPPAGVMLTGTPNATAAVHASPQSRAGHINLKTHQSLRDLMECHFENVFMFGMNDEVVHTGYAPMCHYLWALGAGLRDR